MLDRILLPLGLLASLATARVFDSLPHPPRGWSYSHAAESTEPLTLRIALRQQNAAALEQVVLQVSNPRHANYGQHLTRDELRSYTAPTPRAVRSVTSWLVDNGVDDYTVEHDWVTLRTTVGAADRLLGADFAWYAGPGETLQLRTLSYGVDDSVAPHVDLVQPTTRFGGPVGQASHIFKQDDFDEQQLKTLSVGFQVMADPPANGPGSIKAACNESGVTPLCLRTLYRVNYKPATTGNLVAFASFLEQYARYSDQQAFTQRVLGPGVPLQNFSVETVNGGANDQQSKLDSGEANLDLQYVMAMSHPIPILEYSTGSRGPLVPTLDQPNANNSSNEPYLEFLTYLLAQPDSAIPQTLSVSYGEEEQSVPRDYAIKVCNMFMQLGARGVSVMFSSGDSGPGNDCVRASDNATFFGSTFPAGCPYVTSVGSTVGFEPERAVSFSSGGFSIYHARPDYQNEVVPKYIESIKASGYEKFFDGNGRGIPDVAAQGARFVVIDKGRVSLISGTSASSPAFAGMVALVNAARKSKDMPALGFLNPMLYQNAAAMTDIVNGAGIGCRKQRTEFPNGARFNATAGWDPVTGLGTPLFDKLLAVGAPGVPNA
ncbi:tripeptidyl-peptidase 1 [Pyricularia oryzae]|nr:tripeptidyl-peptidase 1 [Pyricularia oryzae]